MSLVCIIAIFLWNLMKNVVIACYHFSLPDCHFSLFYLEGEVTSPYCLGLAWPLLLWQKRFFELFTCPGKWTSGFPALLRGGDNPISLPMLSTELINYHTCKIGCQPSYQEPHHFNQHILTPVQFNGISSPEIHNPSLTVTLHSICRQGKYAK